MRRFDTISEYNAFNRQETFHPLVSVIDLANQPARPKMGRTYYGFYTVLLKDVNCGDLHYGKHTYDYQEGTLVFIGPGQVIGQDNDGELYQPKGHALAFHADSLRGTSLGAHIHEYTFFSYNVNEALHISERERQVVLDCLAKIDVELRLPIDKHSKRRSSRTSNCS